MKLSLSLSVFFLFILTSSIAQTLNEGIAYLENENYTAAIITFNKLAEAEPKNPIYPYYIGEVFYAMDNPKEARKFYDKCLIISSKCDHCHIGLGRLDLDENRIEPAKKHFETALRGNSKTPQIQYLVGNAYLHNKKPNAEEALIYLIKARDLDPSKDEYWISLGDAYMAKGSLGEAMTAYETAVEKDKNNPKTYVKMSRIWVIGKQVDLGIERLENAIKIKPDYAIAYKDLYELYITSRKYDKVVPILEKYVSLSGTDVEAKVRLVKFLCYQAKDYSKAIEEGRNLVKTNPEQYTLYRWLAWSYFETGDAKNSLQSSFSLFSEVNKDSLNRNVYPSDFEYAAKAAAKLNLMDTAELFYLKLMELQPEKSQDIYSILAKAFYDAKRYDKAEKWYLLKSSNSKLANSELLFLAMSFKFQGKLQDADTTFGLILSASPKYDYGWYQRALINSAMDTSAVKLFLAKPYYEKFIELASSDPNKNKDKLVDAYLYLTFYSSQKNDIEMAKSYCNMAYNLKPDDADVKNYYEVLKAQGKSK